MLHPIPSLVMPDSALYILFHLPQIHFPYKLTHLLFSKTTLLISARLVRFLIIYPEQICSFSRINMKFWKMFCEKISCKHFIRIYIFLTASYQSSHSVYAFSTAVTAKIVGLCIPIRSIVTSISFLNFSFGIII